MQFKQTMTFFQPLYKLLKRKAVLPEMVAGLDMIVEDIKQRNYLHAYDIYMRLAIGRISSTMPCSASHCWHATCMSAAGMGGQSGLAY